MLPSESLNFLDGSPDLKCAVACLYDAACKYWTRDKRNQEDCYLLNNLNIGTDRFSNTNYNSGNKLCAHGRVSGKKYNIYYIHICISRGQFKIFVLDSRVKLLRPQ